MTIKLPDILVRSIISAMALLVTVVMLRAGFLDWSFACLVSMLLGIWSRQGSIFCRIKAVGAGVAVSAVIFISAIGILLGVGANAPAARWIVGLLLGVLGLVAAYWVTRSILRESQSSEISGSVSN
jgi:hypothetical protein